jgi:hypothetical protein
MIAALFVATGGCYFGLPDVDPWDIFRDARLYAGPHPVVAHPPCERWGRFATVGGQLVGDDEGCFEAALIAVRRFGGVLEHPEGSHAWKRFGLLPPPRAGGWHTRTGRRPIEWTCCIEQGRYGHRAPKKTWLFASGMVSLPELRWGITPPDMSLSPRQRKTGICQRLSHKQRAATPIPFRDLLLDIARTAAPNAG